MTFTNDLQQGLSPYRQKVNEVLRYLVEFLKNPVQGMRTPPQWEWQVLLIFNATLAAAFGVLTGIVKFSFAQIFAGLIVSPISNTFIVIVVTGFFYYTFLFFFKREVPPKKLLAIVILANLAPIAFTPIEAYLPQANIVSLTAMTLLLYVGFVENTGIDRKKIGRLLGGLFVVFLVFWIYSTISITQEKKSLKNFTTPGTLDILEQDFNSDSN